ncbi:FkbM family methyltransferase [Vibrio sp. RC27]
MLRRIEIKLYQKLASIARKQLFFQKIFMLLVPTSRVKNLNIEEDIRLKSGEIFKIYTRHWIGFRCFVSGAYDIEENEEFHMMSLLRKLGVSTFMDVGSNHGYYSLKIASLLSENGLIYAFEPFSKNIKILKENIRNNLFSEKIIVIRKIISDTCTKQKIYYAGEQNPGASSCVVFDSSKEFESVDSTTLDLFITEVGCTVDFLKIDVEGFELNVLKGMPSTLKNQKPILFIEHNSSTLKSNGDSITDIVDYMKSFEYEAFDISSGTIMPYLGGDRNLVLYCHVSHSHKILVE